MSQIEPAGVPSGNGKYIAIAALLLIGIGALVVWKFVLNKPEEQPQTANSAKEVLSKYEEKKRERAEKEDLPPPVKPEPDASVEPEASNKVIAKGPGPVQGGPATTAAGDCGKCTGVGGSDLAAAIRSRAASAQNCYNRALVQDSTLRGRVNVVVKVSSTGRVCGAGVTLNEVGGSVGQCVAGVMGSGAYPAPQGGCVDVNVPFNFVTNR